ncbi:hypothetical protein LTR95_012365 [Oleoguttula sp. CCFEE 5521]
MKTWIIVGASRGIWREFVRQALERGDRVIATVRKPKGDTVASLWPTAKPAQCQVFHCDMLDGTSITQFAEAVGAINDTVIDYIVLNAGVLQYPNVRFIEAAEGVARIFSAAAPEGKTCSGITSFRSYANFQFHLQTNTIGPILAASSLLRNLNTPPKTLTFISSDSGSVQRFRPEEDGFAAYAASKAALNQSLRHMAAELQRKGSEVIVLAIHPGEVKTDMANVDLGWEVEGQIEVDESVRGCVKVIEGRENGDTGAFWTWEGEVSSHALTSSVLLTDLDSAVPLVKGTRGTSYQTIVTARP